MKEGKGMKFTLVDGTGSDTKAPRPRTRGVLQVLYDTIEGLGGNASSKEIVKYVPAAITDARQAYKLSQIDKGLYNGVYRGYFTCTPDRKYYSIAPKSYYDARQEFIKSPAKSTKPKQAPRSSPDDQMPVVIVRTNWWIVGVSSALSFIAGALACMMTGL